MHIIRAFTVKPSKEVCLANPVQFREGWDYSVVAIDPNKDRILVVDGLGKLTWIALDECTVYRMSDL